MNNILIVEDEHLIARLIEMTLTRAGYRCTLAEDGRTAADLIETTNFDMALLDIMLPGLDGYALLECLRPQGVPVIFITAKSAVKDRVQGLRLGADDYITKPFAAEELVARMETVLRRTGRGPSSTDTRSCTPSRSCPSSRAFCADGQCGCQRCADFRCRGCRPRRAHTSRRGRAPRRGCASKAPTDRIPGGAAPQAHRSGGRCG